VVTLRCRAYTPPTGSWAAGDRTRASASNGTLRARGVPLGDARSGAPDLPDWGVRLDDAATTRTGSCPPNRRCRHSTCGACSVTHPVAPTRANTLVPGRGACRFSSGQRRQRPAATPRRSTNAGCLDRVAHGPVSGRLVAVATADKRADRRSTPACDRGRRGRPARQAFGKQAARAELAHVRAGSRS
jgi:hypothetical protein